MNSNLTLRDNDGMTLLPNAFEDGFENGVRFDAFGFALKV